MDPSKYKHGLEHIGIVSTTTILRRSPKDLAVQTSSGAHMDTNEDLIIADSLRPGHLRSEEVGRFQLAKSVKCCLPSISIPTCLGVD